MKQDVATFTGHTDVGHPYVLKQTEMEQQKALIFTGPKSLNPDVSRFFLGL